MTFLNILSIILFFIFSIFYFKSIETKLFEAVFVYIGLIFISIFAYLALDFEYLISYSPVFYLMLVPAMPNIILLFYTVSLYSRFRNSNNNVSIFFLLVFSSILLVMFSTLTAKAAYEKSFVSEKLCSFEYKLEHNRQIENNTSLDCKKQIEKIKSNLNINNSYQPIVILLISLFFSFSLVSAVYLEKEECLE